MELVAEYLGDIILLETEGLLEFFRGDLIYVYEDSWKRFSPISDEKLDPYLRHGIIQFIPLEKFGFNEVMELRQRHNRGISPETLCKICFCKQRALPLLTNNRAVTRVANLEGVEVQALEEMRTNLIGVKKKYMNMI